MLSDGLRRSASISSTVDPSSAVTIARLAATAEAPLRDVMPTTASERARASRCGTVRFASTIRIGSSRMAHRLGADERPRLLVHRRMAGQHAQHGHAGRLAQGAGVGDPREQAIPEQRRHDAEQQAGDVDRDHRQVGRQRRPLRLVGR